MLAVVQEAYVHGVSTRKVDELMKLCDELEARQAKQRETGTRLTKAALEGLANADGAAELEAAWERVVGHFEGLIRRSMYLCHGPDFVLPCVNSFNARGAFFSASIWICQF